MHLDRSGDREAAARLSGPRHFDRDIQRQEVAS
ncbi:hypothetical protein MMMDOFMJ_3925 [Methylobacterium gnaphalii]|nr:hypothetical protein MMMDOFMJ_3925 [Methylobacterium gnaphalii]